jgi:hypothetical protein
MYTLALMVFLVAAFQALVHVHRVSEYDKFEWALHAAVYWAFLIVAGLVGWAIWTDLHPEAPVNILTDHDFPKRFYVVLAFNFWGLSSFYRIWINRYTGTRRAFQRKDSVLTLGIAPVVSIVSFIGSVLGIVSFYLQFLRK